MSTARKPTRVRELRPDSNGAYRPYIGWTVRNYKPIQPRFNLGYDRLEANKRYARIQELCAEDRHARGDRYWSDFGLYAATLIARGIYRIPFSPPDELLEAVGDPGSEYAQIVEIQRRTYPSLEIVPVDEAWYSLSVILHAAEVVKIGKRLYARDPLLHHLKGQHESVAGQGWYRIQVGIRATYWKFAKPTAD